MDFIDYPPLHSSKEETNGIIQVKKNQFLYRTHVKIGKLNFCIAIYTDPILNIAGLQIKKLVD